MVYLIHLRKKFHHCRHYIGFVDGGQKELKARFERHKNGSGSKLLRAVAKAGIKFSIVRTWPDGDRKFERSLKNKKNSKCLCPKCSPKIKEATKAIAALPTVYDIMTRDVMLEMQSFLASPMNS